MPNPHTFTGDPNDAAKALGMNPGSIANNLKSNGVCNNGYRFKTTVPNFSRP